jgi:Family of unknown function (DUF6049)
MRRTVTRFLLAPAVALVVLTPGPRVTQAAAQAAEGVTIRLAFESTWTAPDRPLVIRVRVTNNGSQPLDGLTTVLTIEARARSRSEYQLSLRQDGTVIFSYPFQQEGTIEPGGSRNFTLGQDLPFLTQNGLYPLRVQVLSHEQPVATLRTPMVFLAEHPETPLHVAWTWVLSAPLQVGPDGIFGPGPIEAVIAPGGSIAAMVDAMESGTPGPIDVAMSPVLADELSRMSAGYRIRNPDGTVRTVASGTGGAADAASILTTLRRIAGRPRTELVALPFADTRIPALFQAGLGGDLRTLIERGRIEVGRILGADPVTPIFRPPLSQIDGGTAAQLRQLGITTLLLDHRTVPTSAAQFPNPEPMVRLAGASGTEALVEDAEVAGVAEAAGQDAQLAAHVALGQMASVWLESPGHPGRGISALFPEQSKYPPRFYRAFVSLVRGSPWLKPSTAAGMASLVTDVGQASLASTPYPGLPSSLVDSLVRARGRLTLFESTARAADRLLNRIRTGLLLAEGGTSIDQPSVGVAYVTWAEGQMDAVYRLVSPEIPPIVTLTSQRGSPPLFLRNDNAYPLKVAVRLIADRRLVFPNGNIRVLTLPARGLTRVRIEVRAQTTGRFPITLQILPALPCVNCSIAETRVVIRSTAYNRIALLLTIGAAVFLLAWWGRRFLPRRAT